MNRHFVEVLLILIGAAVGLGLVIAALVYARSPRRSKRYRPGRPFVFEPVWFVSAPEYQSRAAIRPGRELTRPSGQVVPRGTGGASDRW